MLSMLGWKATALKVGGWPWQEPLVYQVSSGTRTHLSLIVGPYMGRVAGTSVPRSW